MEIYFFDINNYQYEYFVDLTHPIHLNQRMQKTFPNKLNQINEFTKIDLYRYFKLVERIVKRNLSHER